MQDTVWEQASTGALPPVDERSHWNRSSHSSASHESFGEHIEPSDTVSALLTRKSATPSAGRPRASNIVFIPTQAETGAIWIGADHRSRNRDMDDLASQACGLPKPLRRRLPISLCLRMAAGVC